MTPFLEPMARFLFSHNCAFLDVGCPLWQEDGSVIYSYNRFWALPWFKSRRTQHHIFLSYLKLHSPGWQGPCIQTPHEECAPVIPPGTATPLRHLLQLAGLRRRYSNASTLVYHLQRTPSCRNIRFSEFVEIASLYATVFSSFTG
jgi:hypothetical protein